MGQENRSEEEPKERPKAHSSVPRREQESTRYDGPQYPAFPSRATATHTDTTRPSRVPPSSLPFSKSWPLNTSGNYIHDSLA